MKLIDRFKIARNAYSYRLLKRKGKNPETTNVIIPESQRIYLGCNLPIIEICLNAQLVVARKMDDEFTIMVDCLSDEIIEKLCNILEKDILDNAELS